MGAEQSVPVEKHRKQAKGRHDTPADIVRAHNETDKDNTAGQTAEQSHSNQPDTTLAQTTSLKEISSNDKIITSAEEKLLQEKSGKTYQHVVKQSPRNNRSHDVVLSPDGTSTKSASPSMDVKVRPTTAHISSGEKQTGDSSYHTGTSSADAEDVTVTVRGPSDSKQNMNTIKQAKVNVRDRITFFKDANTHLDPSKKPPGYRKSSTDEYNSIEEMALHGQPIPILLSPKGLDPSSKAERKVLSPLAENKGHDLHEKAYHEQTTHKSSDLSPAAQKQQPFNSPENVPIGSPEPMIDYTLERPAAKASMNRMNTLEYFRQVQRDGSVLRGYERAKPAAMNKKGKAKDKAGGGKLPRNGERPVTMFSSAHLYGSQPDLVVTENHVTFEETENMLLAAEHIRMEKQEQLASTNKHGQRYAMDDTAYETLSRRKKIPGQVLAIGIVDKETERNFLLSLKRNAHFKHARESEADTDDHMGHTVLTDMVF